MTENDYHKWIRKQECVRCGFPHAEVAHYSGKYSSSLGKGMGRKSWFHCCAALCRACHQDVDLYKAGNDDARAIRLMLDIFETQRRYFSR